VEELGWKEQDWKFKLGIMLIVCFICGLIGGVIAVNIITQMGGEPGTIGFWIGFGIGFFVPVFLYMEF
jgi:hypothetical protein